MLMSKRGAPPPSSASLAPHVFVVHPPPPPPPPSPWRRRLSLLLCPVAFLTLLALLDVVYLLLSGAPASSWLGAASHASTLRAWGGAVGDAAAWALSDARSSRLLPPLARAQAGRDEFGAPTLAAACEAAAAGQDPGWPLVPTGVVPNASALCSALLSLPSALRVYTHRLPCRLARTGLLPLIAPSFNRGYPLEAYLVRAIRRGPFATRNATHATAFLLPLRPYALRVAAFPGDGLAAVQARVASTEAWLDADGGKSGAAWRRNAGCDHILVSTHDKGGRVAAGAHALQSRGILVASTADTVPSSAAEEGRYTAGKDVAGICSFSLALPKWAAWRGACPSVPQPRGAPPRLSRTHALAFVGGSLGHVRSALFSHFAQHPWPDFAPVHGHVSPSGYMTSLLTSKFCLHVRGTQVQSPRLIEAILFGCVPVIMADTYDLPLSDVLDWPSFSIRVPQGSPEMLRPAVEAADYESLSKKVCSVAPFFAYHASPRPGDAFHMTMMEVFLRLKAPRPGCNGVPLLSPPPFLPIDNATAAPPLQPRRLLAT